MNVTVNDWMSVGPALALILGAFAVVAIGAIVRPERRQVFSEYISYVVLGYAIISSIFILYRGDGSRSVMIEGFQGAPEPATWMLMGSGFVALGAAKMWRARRRAPNACRMRLRQMADGL